MLWYNGHLCVKFIIQCHCYVGVCNCDVIAYDEKFPRIVKSVLLGKLREFLITDARVFQENQMLSSIDLSEVRDLIN